MKTVDILFGTLLILVLFTVAHSWCSTTETQTESYGNVAANRLTLFTADWCPHCHALLNKGVWKDLKVAVDADSSLSSLSLEHLTQEENKDTWASYGIAGVPAIVLNKADGTKIQMPYPIDDVSKIITFVKSNV